METETKSVREIVAGYIDSHEGVKTARAKLADLDSRAKAIETELTSLQESTASTTLVDRLLNGDTLAEHDDVIGKRQALSEKLEAYRGAITKQKQTVEDQEAIALREAQEPVMKQVRPKYEQCVNEFLAYLGLVDESLESLRKLMLDLDAAQIQRLGSMPSYDGVKRALNQINYFCDHAAMSPIPVAKA